MKFITLTTDFGMQDGYAGVLRGVIWSIAPEAQVADLSHSVNPQNILQGAMILRQYGKYFPPGTVHVGVVDPGVGTARRPIAARMGETYYSGPDNGLCSLLMEDAELQGKPVEVVHLNQRGYWLDDVSSVFHGRDIFAPTAAHLANGVGLDELGTRINDPIRLHIPPVKREGKHWDAQVLYVDVFGNIVLNMRREDIPASSSLSMEIHGTRIERLVNAYGDSPAGDLVALFGSSGYLEAAEVNGNAARRLGAAAGDAVLVYTDGSANG